MQAQLYAVCNSGETTPRVRSSQIVGRTEVIRKMTLEPFRMRVLPEA